MVLVVPAPPSIPLGAAPRQDIPLGVAPRQDIPLGGAPRYWIVDFGRGEVTRKGAGPNEKALALCLLGEEP